MKHAWLVVVVCLASACWGADVFPQLEVKAPPAKEPVKLGLFNNTVPTKALVPMAPGLWKFELWQLDESVDVRAMALDVDANGTITGEYHNDGASACQVSGFARTDINNSRRILRLAVTCPGGITSFFGTLSKDGKSIDVGNYSVTNAGRIQMPVIGHFKASLI